MCNSVGKSRNSMVKGLVLVAALLLIGAGAVFALNLPGLGKCEKVTAVNGVVSIPLAKVADGKAHYYAYSDAGKVINFFVVKAKDGSVKTAFDACDVCYEAKKGYTQQGEAMVCNKCNKKFATDKIGPSSAGGCNPSYLPHQEAGGNVLLKVEDLKAGARFF